LIEFAIASAILVFPTPGGPNRQIIFPLTTPFNNPTAINYKILYLTSFIP